MKPFRQKQKKCELPRRHLFFDSAVSSTPLNILANPKSHAKSFRVCNRASGEMFDEKNRRRNIV
jgi:hypothetical protein